MKSALIYFPERKISPKGGPAGYLYNLREGLKSLEQNEIKISFYSDISIELEENLVLRNCIPKRMREIRRAYKFANYLKRQTPIDSSMMQYDVIHFHSTEEMYMNRNLLSKYKGKVILTSHTPCVPYQEIIGRLNPVDYQVLKRKVDGLVAMDKYAFERANYIIFPCEEAEEPYFHTWKEYADIRKPEKYRYVPTGIVGCTTKISKQDYRKKYHIPGDAFVVSYVGRHNEIKGYSDLKKIGKKILKDRDVYFLVAGREEPITGLSDEHWIEVGWTKDPHSLIAASDVFILPNRETYFDLILLEAISLGIPVVISYTGGNKFFERYKTSGIKFYKNLNSAVLAVEEIRSMSLDKIEHMRETNLQLFSKYFTVEHFAQSYINVMQEIV